MNPSASDRHACVEGVRRGDKAALARAITVVESRREADRELADQVLQDLLPETGKAHRIAISGPPGAGKSTLIDALGCALVDRGRRVAVLAIDPSSSLSGGSILGDKTRMSRLAAREEAFIRPSPTRSALGGVAPRTREALLLCEAAGFDVVLVETVGVGQSETAVRDLVDTFCVLLLPGAGDELQGIKRGILELADVLAVNKCDGDQAARAREAVTQYSAALRYLAPGRGGETPRVLAVSARTGAGIDELWSALEEHRDRLERTGALERQREEQARRWLWRAVEDELVDSLRSDPRVAGFLEREERAVVAGVKPASAVARELLRAFRDAGGRADPTSGSGA